MIGPGRAGSVMEAVAEGFVTGLVGTLGVTIDDDLGNNVVPRTTASITEIQTVGAFGVYAYIGVFPATIGTYTITWDDTVLTASEYIEVDDIPPSPEDAPTAGPCAEWVTAEEIADCCGVEYGSDTDEALEIAAGQASGVLYALSGSLFAGWCGPVTVRPCSQGNRCYVPGRSDWIRPCGCAPLSEVLLPGYPVVAIGQVKIDGEVLSPSAYQLVGYRKLVRMADAEGGSQVWPACQRLDLPTTEERTFSVTYYHGMYPPALGLAAAAQLGCELYRACTAGAGECALPSNVTRTTRQGVTIEREPLSAFLASRQTGLVKVDAFLAAYGSDGARRRPSVWSPSGPMYARQEGV